MLSMTGFGQSQIIEEGYKVDVSIKSVNAKFLDIEFKAPKSVLLKEEYFKKLISQRATRGTITVFIVINKLGSSLTDVALDVDLAKSIYDKTNELSAVLGVPSALTGKDLVRFNGVLTTQEMEVDVEQLCSCVEKALIMALDCFTETKVKEGDNLKQDLKEKIEALSGVLEQIRIKAPLVHKEYYEKLKLRINELLDGTEIDESRIVNEVAFFVDKADINEEVVRLSSHIMQFNDYLLESGSVGKKLEFLSQEMTREINTIGSKANNIDITKLVLMAKNINETIKEQIRNVE